MEECQWYNWQIYILWLWDNKQCFCRCTYVQFLLPSKLLITLRLHLLIPSSLHLFLLILSSIRFSILMFGNPQALMAFFPREVASEIAVEQLIKLYNASLRFGSIPSDWKQSNVTAVHKYGCKDDPSNFRPISVVPVLAKILEKLVTSQPSTYFAGSQEGIWFIGSYHTIEMVKCPGYSWYCIILVY